MKFYQHDGLQVTSLDVIAVRDWIRGAIVKLTERDAPPFLIGFFQAALHEPDDDLFVEALMEGRKRLRESGGQCVRYEFIELEGLDEPEEPST